MLGITRCRFRHHDARYRSGIEAKHPATDIGEGSNMIMIHPGADRRGGVRQDPSAMQTLKLTDYEALRDETNFLSAISQCVFVGTAYRG